MIINLFKKFFKPKDLSEKDYDLIRQAIKKAQTILAKAELESIQTVADNRVLNRKLEEEYEEQITTRATEVEREFTQFLKDLQVRAEQSQLLLENTSRQKTEEVLQRFEKNLASFLAACQQQGIGSINAEVNTAKKLIEDYKKQRMATIDENIADIVEETTAKVLSKKLSLKDQTDLIYEALEQAKKDNLIS
ncbi:MAG: hypothetical protein V1808_00260 [Candidatus Daviesbacteria bacterium]